MAIGEKIVPINIDDLMKSSYIDYSMSVIVSRALPDVRDGLKPVHRRILYAMMDLGLTYNKSHKKSARIVGEVLGKYHPHGDTAVYDSLVRMAQSWSLRYPLVDGQGNFGSMDGDNPAAMRYTEARLRQIADELLADIKKETVNFENNFDDTLEEPTVLPARVPTLLINGASGIAVGMATNMLPHNLTEVIEGIIATINNPEITIDELIEYIKAPDFPTGGIIYGYSGVREAFETGRGRVVVRGKANIEVDGNERERIIITEIPYQVNRSVMIKKIADLVNDEKIKGISDIRDESDRDGLRVVVDVRKDALANVVLSKLYKYTPLQTSYGVNNIALVNGRPKQLNLKELIQHFIDFRIEVIVRRTQYELRKAEERAHILEGLLVALDHLDEVIELIRASNTVDEARNVLMDRFSLSELQVRAILEMRLQKLTGLERGKVKEEYAELQEKIKDYKDILSNEERQKTVAREELEEIKEKYGDDRRTEISYTDGEISLTDMIPNHKMVVTISHSGYIKRTRVERFKKQNRGGRGSRGSRTKNEDFIEHLFVAHNHNYLLLFTEKGRCYWLRVYEIPEAKKNSLGRAIQNIVNLPKDDSIRAYINIEDLADEEFINDHYIFFATKKGTVKKTLVEAFSRPRVNGINAMNVKEKDQLLEAKLTDGRKNILLAHSEGRAIRFHERDVRSSGRTSGGVRGIRIPKKADVIGMITADEGENITVLVLSENGYGKRSELEDYSLIGRGGKGVKTLNLTQKTGKVVSIKAVIDTDDLMISTKGGIIIRMGVEDIRTMGRHTQGVRVIRLGEEDGIADVAVLPLSDEEE